MYGQDLPSFSDQTCTGLQTPPPPLPGHKLLIVVHFHVACFAFPSLMAREAAVCAVLDRESALLSKAS